MKRLIATIAAGALTMTLFAGCETREDTGAVIGGLTGAAVGSAVGGGEGRTAAIIIGTLAGTVIGSKIGRQMDEQDRMRTAQALEYNRTNQTTAWRNPDSGHSYTVTPTETYERDNGQPCREFTMDAYIGGKTEQVYGTACRQPDGSWKVVK